MIQKQLRKSSRKLQMPMKSYLIQKKDKCMMSMEKKELEDNLLARTQMVLISKVVDNNSTSTLMKSLSSSLVGEVALVNKQKGVKNNKLFNSTLVVEDLEDKVDNSINNNTKINNSMRK